MTNVEYDKLLFDGDDLFILKYYENCKKWDPNNFNEYNKLKIIDAEIKNKIFFSVGSTPIISQCNGQILSRSISYMFKEYIVDIHQDCYGHNEFNFGSVTIKLIKHTIPYHILFAIKYFPYNKQYSNIINMYNTHPEYFMSEIEKNHILNLNASKYKNTERCGWRIIKSK